MTGPPQVIQIKCSSIENNWEKRTELIGDRSFRFADMTTTREQGHAEASFKFPRVREAVRIAIVLDFHAFDQAEGRKIHRDGLRT